jgi:CRP-like cAMP-binding protein
VSGQTNTILQNLPPSDLKLFESALKPMTLTQSHVLAEQGTPIDRVYFPISGLISVVVPLSGGESIESAVIGRSDVFGAGVAFGASLHVNRGVVQMAGTALTIAGTELAEAANKSQALRNELFFQDRFLLAQAQQSAACNARHDIKQRLATWLLRVHDRAQQDDLPLTQEFIGQMIGVQRPSISLAASELQDAGLILYRRGMIRILDLAGLERVACECFATLREQRSEIMAHQESDRAATAARDAP